MTAALRFIAIALAAAVLLGATRVYTAPRIAANEAAREASVRAELLGAVGGNITRSDPRLCKVRTRGYAGSIDLILGVDRPHTLLAVRVSRHTETPGIGDFVELSHSRWITGFSRLAAGPDFFARSPSERLQTLNAELDAVSGATVTRRAVLRGVAQGCPP